MPESHQRHKTKKHHHQAEAGVKKKRINAAIFMSVMGGIFGLSFGYFTGDRSVLWSVVGTIAGVLVGYLFGHNIDKSTAQKK